MENLIIMGSGRSGTSMLAGSFAESGYYMGDDINYLGKNKANPKGFFEDYEINTINEDILENSLVKIPEMIRYNFFRSATYYRFRWLARISINQKIKTDPNINYRIDSKLEKTPFCFKDPRFSYTYPIWENRFKEKVKLVVIYRHPLKTAQSILRECIESNIVRRIHINHAKALDIWKHMYGHILNNYEQSNNKGDWMFIHYNQVFNDKIVDKLENFAKVNMDSDFRDKALSRTGSIDQSIQSEEIERMYITLNKLSQYQE